VPSSLWITFKSPWLLLVLLAIPVGVALYAWLEKRRKQRASRWASPALLPNMVSGSPGNKRYIPAAIFGVAVLLLLLGFARPQAKFATTKNGATVVLMIDVSGSMAANDVKPSRLLAADAAITQFVNKLPSKYRASLITFSNGIAVKVPPTYDHQSLLASLPKKTELEGTALGDALSEAIVVAQKAVGPSKPGKPHPPASILLVSDGGQNAGRVQPAAAAAQAKKAAIAVSTVSLGTAAGVVHQKVPVAGTSGKTFPLVSQVPVDASALKTIAKDSGGHFYAAHSANQLTNVYKQLGTKLVKTKQEREVTVDVTIAALLLILVAAGLSAYWFRRLV
jgi:Ca-activated chloride channel family protein